MRYLTTFNRIVIYYCLVYFSFRKQQKNNFIKITKHKFKTQFFAIIITQLL